MKKKILQQVYEETELEDGTKEEALQVRQILATEKLNDTLKDLQSAVSRIADEVTGRE